MSAPGEDRLDSWKAIARHLGRSVRTVRRWEQHEGLPVHRLMHQAQATVFAYASELDAWREGRAQFPAGASSRAAATRTDPAPAPTSLAVLPFTFAGPDPTQAWVADGFTEEMINGFSRLSALRVTSRTSSAAFKDSDRDAGSIARVLDVDHVLEGGVVGDGKRLRISVRLVDAARDDHVWSRRFTGDMEQVFDIQERIARAVVAALQLRLAPEEDRRLAERGVEDIRAWQRLVMARQAALRWRPDTLGQVRQLLVEALALTGENAVICATLGRILLGFRESGTGDGADLVEEASRWADRARAVDPDHPETLALDGWLAYATGDVANAVAKTEQSLQADRDQPDALVLLIFCLLISGQVDRARPVIEHLVAVDRLTPLTKCMPGFANTMEGRFDEAIASYRDMLDSDRGNPVARLFNVWVLFGAGRDDEALAMADGFDSTLKDSTAAHIARRFVAAHLGTVEPAPLPQHVRESAANIEMYARLAAEAWAMAGNGERAAHWLGVAMDRGFANWPYVQRHSPFFRTVADDPSFIPVTEALEQRWQSLKTVLSGSPREK